MTDSKTTAATQQEILAAIAKIKADAGHEAEGGKAPQYAHDMIDAMLSAKTANAAPGSVTTKGAPGWAHDLLDYLWDLF